MTDRRHVAGKPIMLSALIDILQKSLDEKGDCPVEAGCYMEGIGGPPSITRDPDGIYFDFYGADVAEGGEILWGES